MGPIFRPIVKWAGDEEGGLQGRTNPPPTHPKESGANYEGGRRDILGSRGLARDEREGGADDVCKCSRMEAWTFQKKNKA